MCPFYSFRLMVTMGSSTWSHAGAPGSLLLGHVQCPGQGQRNSSALRAGISRALEAVTHLSGLTGDVASLLLPLGL